MHANARRINSMLTICYTRLLIQGDELHYLDNCQSRKKIKEEHREVSFTGETDRIYLHTSDDIRLNDTGTFICRKGY